jgi:hypothetical protein
MDGTGCKVICDALKNNNSLRILELLWNSIESEGIRSIADMLLVNNTLHTLKVYGANGNRRDSEYFFKALEGNSSLTELKWDVPKKSFGVLENALKNNFSIRKLEVANDRIFKPYIKRNKRIHEENISNTKVAAKVIMRSQLYNNLPKELWKVIFNMIQYPGTSINFGESI